MRGGAMPAARQACTEGYARRGYAVGTSVIQLVSLRRQLPLRSTPPV